MFLQGYVDKYVCDKHLEFPNVDDDTIQRRFVRYVIAQRDLLSWPNRQSVIKVCISVELFPILPTTNPKCVINNGQTIQASSDLFM